MPKPPKYLVPNLDFIISHLDSVIVEPYFSQGLPELDRTIVEEEKKQRKMAGNRTLGPWDGKCLGTLMFWENTSLTRM